MSITSSLNGKSKINNTQSFNKNKWRCKTCSESGTSFSTKKDVIRHVENSHLNKNRYKCLFTTESNTCKKSFGRLDKLRQHYKIHAKIHEFQDGVHFSDILGKNARIPIEDIDYEKIPDDEVASPDTSEQIAKRQKQEAPSFKTLSTPYHSLAPKSTSSEIDALSNTPLKTSVEYANINLHPDNFNFNTMSGLFLDDPNPFEFQPDAHSFSEQFFSTEHTSSIGYDDIFSIPFPSSLEKEEGLTSTLPIMTTASTQYHASSSAQQPTQSSNPEYQSNPLSSSNQSEELDFSAILGYIQDN